MKKLVSVLLILSLMALSLSAVAAETSDAAPMQITVAIDGDEVSLTYPAGMMGENEVTEEVSETEAAAGVLSKAIHEDGSVTMVMTLESYEAMLAQLEDSLVAAFDQLTDGATYPSIKTIEANDDFSAFVLRVDKEAYEGSMDAFAIFSLAMNASMYHIFLGIPENEISIAMEIIDDATDEVIDSFAYPDDLGVEE